MSDLSGYDAALAKEYGTYRAKVDITYEGARAYNAGDPVPVSNVEAHGYLTDGLVEEVTAPTEQPVEQPTVVEPVVSSPSPGFTTPSTDSTNSPEGV